MTATDIEALRVGLAILDAHGQWEQENNRLGGQYPWGREHCILLGRTAIAAIPPQPAEGCSSNEGAG